MFREGVLEVVVSQFMMHELQHHPDRDVSVGEVSPRMPRAHTLADIYKCLHQGEFGPGHMIDDRERFSERLVEEIHTVPAVSDEPILESIAPDDSIFRVNLRPFKGVFYGDDLGTACRVLAMACVESAGIREGTADRLVGKLEAFRAVNEVVGFVVGGIRFAFPDQLVAAFLRDTLALARASLALPVLGHSLTYHQLNAPSYRVVEEIVLRGSPLAFLLGEET